MQIDETREDPVVRASTVQNTGAINGTRKRERVEYGSSGGGEAPQWGRIGVEEGAGWGWLSKGQRRKAMLLTTLPNDTGSIFVT